jgi:RsmE family RNA methyltransferase
MNRILFQSHELTDGQVLLSDHRADHLRQVLKVERGQGVRVGIVNGSKGQGIIEDVNAEEIRLRVELDADAPPRPRVHLVLALPRPKIMKRLWAPLASLGVDQIILIHAEKVEKTYWSTHTLNKEFYQPLLMEGLQQCGDTQLPRVRCVRAFRPFVEDELPTLSQGCNRLLAYEGEAPALSVLGSRAQAPTWVTIGPEGGWNAFEVEKLKEVCFCPFSLGDRILRSDIACIAALTLVHGGG